MRRFPPLAPWLVLAACSSAGSDASPPEGGRPEQLDAAWVDAASNLCRHSTKLDLPSAAPEVLLLLDRSESMSSGFGAVTRYQALFSTLRELTAAYQRRIHFGFAEFPSRTADCDSPGCCADGPSVATAAENAAAVHAAMAAVVPLGGHSPTAAALREARRYYAESRSGATARYVLLATDGRPTCTLSGDLSSGSYADFDGGLQPSKACSDAVAEAEALVDVGVKVIVLGVGVGTGGDTDSRPACLDELAHAGGAARSPGSPGFYSVGDQEELELALELIFGGLARASCWLYLPAAPTSAGLVSIYLDGQQIPRNREDGWDFDPSSDLRQIHFFGEYCRRIERFQFDTIDARFGCVPCSGPAGCL